MFNYGGRNGMATLVRLMKAICHIYVRYQERILTYVNGSSLPVAQKDALINWLNLAAASCAILTSLAYTYE